MDKLVEGYLAYTSTEEFGAAAVGDAPATPIVVTVTLATAGAASGASISETVQHGC